MLHRCISGGHRGMAFVWPILVLMSCLAGNAAASDWVKVTSPDFVVYSDAGARNATRVAGELEVVRTIFQSGLGHLSTDPNRSLIVIALDDRDDLATLIPEFRDQRGSVRGAFRAGSLEHHIVLATDGRRRDSRQVVYHEYFHLLTSLTAGRLPPWLEEGLAEFYSNLTVRGDTVELGNPRPEYLEVLTLRQLLPLSEMLRAEVAPHARGSYEVTRFYAQAWAVVHYVMLGGGSTDGGRRIDRFVERVAKGADVITAFEDTIGPVDEIERALRRYVRRGSFDAQRMPTPPGLDEETYVVEALTPAMALAVQAGVLAQGTEPEAARPLVDAALAQDPGLARAHEARGLMHLYLDERDNAAAAFEKAIALGSERYIPYYGAAFVAIDRANAGTEDQGDVSRWLRHAIELQPRFAPAHMLLAAVLINEVPVPEEAVEHALRAVYIEPSDVQHWVVLGEALLARNRVDEARNVAERGLGWADSPGERKRLHAFLTKTRSTRSTLARASQLLMSGHLEAAAESYRTAIAIDPTDPDAHIGLGHALSELDQLAEATAAYQAAIAIAPSNRIAHSALGTVLVRQGQLDAAAEAFRRAVEPTGAEVLESAR